MHLKNEAGPPWIDRGVTEPGHAARCPLPFSQTRDILFIAKHVGMEDVTMTIGINQNESVQSCLRNRLACKVRNNKKIGISGGYCVPNYLHEKKKL